jgi:DNA modification methylase
MTEVKHWENRKMKLEDLKPADYNPREIEDKNFAGLEKSIERFGMLEPIVWNERTGNIVGGHQRFKVLMSKGEEEVDVVVVDLSVDEEVACNIALNNPNIQGNWAENIGDLLKEIKGNMSDAFDDLLLGDLASDLGIKFDEDKKPKDDDVPSLPKESKSKYGEVYQLGRHRLMCGNSTLIKDVNKLMDGKLADIVITDPPYNVDYTGKTKDALKINNDAMGAEAFVAFLIDAFTCMEVSMRPGAAFYIWHADSEGYAFRLACMKADLKIRQVLIWAKNVFVMGRQDYQWKHEPCLYGWKDEGKCVECGEERTWIPPDYDPDHQPCLYGWKDGAHFWNSDRRQSTLIEVAKPARSSEHPTMKPVELFEYQALNNTKKGDLLFDPFGGSGTSVIVAEKIERVCHLMELDPHYVDVIRQRWAEYVNGEGCDWEKLTPVVKD